MKAKLFIPCLLALSIFIAFFYSCKVQNPTLVVTIRLDLFVTRDSSSIPGFGQILELNTSVKVIKWPQIANENVGINPKYAFNETRNKPVQFAVSVCLDDRNNTVLTRNLTTTGGYSAVVSSAFPDTSRGTHNLTIAVYALGYEDAKSQLKRFIAIP